MWIIVDADSPLATKQGYCSARIGKPFSANPYIAIRDGLKHIQDWDDGWEAFHKKKGIRQESESLKRHLSPAQQKEVNARKSGRLKG